MSLWGFGAHCCFLRFGRPIVLAQNVHTLWNGDQDQANLVHDPSIEANSTQNECLSPCSLPKAFRLVSFTKWEWVLKFGYEPIVSVPQNSVTYDRAIKIGFIIFRSDLVSVHGVWLLLFPFVAAKETQDLSAFSILLLLRNRNWLIFIH